MKLEGKIRTAAGVRTATGEAPTYDEAKSRLGAQVEAGEYLLSFRRLDD